MINPSLTNKSELKGFKNQNPLLRKTHFTQAATYLNNSRNIILQQLEVLIWQKKWKNTI